MADSQVAPLDVPPGLKANVSEAAAKGRYIRANKVRFNDGKPEKIGGYLRWFATALNGIVRGMLPWVSQSNVSFLAAGTAVKVYVITDVLKDITPLRASGTLVNDAFAVVISTPTVTVTHTAHGLSVGAHVHFSGATAGGGITVSGEYTVVSVPTSGSYTITHTSNATSTDSTTGGAAIAFSYEINPGIADTAYGLGWGAGTWNQSTWGTPRSSAGITYEHRTWFFDNYGNVGLGGILIAQPSGGGLYYWDEPAAAARLVPITNAPTAMRASFVTNERMVVALGTTSAMTMAWSDRDDFTVWTPAVANTANIRTLQEGTRLIAGSRFNDVNVIWSDSAFYLMNFINSAQEIYDTPVAGKGCGLVGPLAYEVLSGLIMWFSSSLDVFIYSGGIVQKAPNWDEIRGYIVQRLDLTRLAKMEVGATPSWSEVWFHYVSIDSPNGEPDECFIVNWDDWVWYFSPDFSEGRTGHVYFRGPSGAVLMAGADSYIYQHEVGKDANGAAMPWSLETGPVALFKDRDCDYNGYIPDFERISGTVHLQVKTQEWPMSQAMLGDQTFVLSPTTDKQDINMGGRYARMVLSGDNLGDDFRLGIPLIDVAPAGKTR